MTERQKILIVDDRPENLWALAATLRDAEADIIQASSGNAALIACLNHDFALAILDVQMPGMDGFELAQLLHGDAKTAHLPIIFLTAAYAEEQHVFRGYAAGAVDYVVKPYDAAILLSKVRVFLELERHRAEIARHRDHLDELVRKRTAELEVVNEDLRLSRAKTLKLLEEAVESHEKSEQMNVQLQHEIAERKIVEESLARARDEAEAASRMSSQFLANMSHEIRTPMNGVIGMTDLLLDTSLSAEQRRYANLIRSSGGALLSLLNDILDISKIEAGKVELEVLEFDVRDMVESFAAPLAMRAKSKGIEFDCVVEPNVPSQVCGAPGRLRQILTNLAGNAVKFTEEGGVNVQVSVVSETPDASIIRFSVRDTGIGIPSEHQTRLFRKFTQADASTTRRYGGSGLGLAIAKELVELMGGEIGVNSQAGLGSEFWLTVCLGKVAGKTERADAAAPRRDLPAKSLTVHRKGARILVAEDNVVNQEVALGILNKLGLRAEAVADGAEAIEMLKTLPYDLVLMDVQMPEMDGLEATRIIRDPQTSVLNPRIPIIAMTAHAMLGDREYCLQTGMNDYVTKPISPPALIEALNTWLPAAHRMPSISAGLNNVGEPASSEVPVYDHAKVQARLMDDEELVSSVLDQFLTSMPEQLELLRQAVETEDAKRAELTAHAIKGAAANVDGERLRCVAREMEQAVHVRDWNVAKGHLAELQLQFERLQDAIQTHRRP